jgi:hypothetical protein
MPTVWLERSFLEERRRTKVIPPCVEMALCFWLSDHRMLCPCDVAPRRFGLVQIAFW